MSIDPNDYRRTLYGWVERTAPDTDDSCDECAIDAQLAAIDADLANSIAYYDQAIALNMCGEHWAEMQKRNARRSAENQRAYVQRELAA